MIKRFLGVFGFPIVFGLLIIISLFGLVAWIVFGTKAIDYTESILQKVVTTIYEL